MTAALRSKKRCISQSPARHTDPGPVTLHRWICAASSSSCQLEDIHLPLPSYPTGNASCRPQSLPRAGHHNHSPAAHQLRVHIRNGFPVHSIEQLLQLHQRQLAQLQLVRSQWLQKEETLPEVVLRQWHLASCTILLSCFWAEATSEASKGKSGEV